MNIIQLLKQDVINITDGLKYHYQENVIVLIALLVFISITMASFHCLMKRTLKQDYVVQTIGIKMDYVYKGVKNSYIFINKRNDGKIDITNEKGETMFTEMKDVLPVNEAIIKL